jgi:hypothetical protein
MSCPECRYPRYKATESHYVMRGEARRVRRRCASCGHTGTIYEVSKALLDELTELRTLRSKVQELLGGGGEPAGGGPYCVECKHWGPDGCGLDLPEAGGGFAAECSTFNPGP